MGISQMIVTCVRCEKEFASEHTDTHTCPSCHFVFEADLNRDKPLPGLEREPDEDPGGPHEGARCAFHPDVDAVGCCSGCGKPVCYVCAVKTGHGHHCESCAESSGDFPNAEYQTEPPTSAPDWSFRGKRESDPEEQQGGFGTFLRRRRKTDHGRAMLDIWLSTLFGPGRFFRLSLEEVGYLRALGYGALWALVGIAGGLLWGASLRLYQTALPIFQGETVEVLVKLTPTHGWAAVAALFSPLIAMLALLAVSAVYHLSASVFIRESSGFGATLKVVCYGMGALAFYLVPSFGGLLAGIWHMAIVTSGFREVHRTSLSSALAAAFIPCSLTFAAGIAFTSWAVAGSRFDVTTLLGKLFASIAG